MKKIHQMGGTIIMISHDMHLVAEYASRVVVLKQGKIALDGSPKEIFFRNFEDLEAWQLNPPTVPRMTYDLREQGFPKSEAGLYPPTNGCRKITAGRCLSATPGRWR